MNTKIIFFAIAMVVAMAITTTVTVQSVFASGGGSSTCAFSFTPKSLSSSLSGTGEHGVQHIFAPGQEAQASGASASSFSPGQSKP
jgi:hypothetical protein